MSNKEIQEFVERLDRGLDLAERRMLEEKALHGQDVIVCDERDNIVRVPAKEALEKLNKSNEEAQ